MTGLKKILLMTAIVVGLALVMLAGAGIARIATGPGAAPQPGQPAATAVPTASPTPRPTPTSTPFTPDEDQVALLAIAERYAGVTQTWTASDCEGTIEVNSPGAVALTAKPGAIGINWFTANGNDIFAEYTLEGGAAVPVAGSAVTRGGCTLIPETLR
ncbi:hypothetical protein LG299_12505 [Microbacterium lacus]|uniref:hypothetical protein n=1 Tax=Microbacterium lacus TaxID=415217 RepID=UPI00384B63CD